MRGKGGPHFKKAFRQAGARQPAPASIPSTSTFLDLLASATPAVQDQYRALTAHYTLADALAYVEARIRRYPDARDFWRAVYKLLLAVSRS